ncbi:MAG: hypothetical protein EA384_15100 [Spirochaetaceae bacterium]|nr:MAG: hypothetical protein EA384_15100 [Spirochaetaceae bacterium]
MLLCHAYQATEYRYHDHRGSRVNRRASRRLRLALLMIILVPVTLYGQRGADRPLRIDTEHFTFIYRSGDHQAVEELLSVADSVYQRVTGFLDYQPSERIPVVVRGGTATANGYFSPYPPRITLFVSSPSGPWLGASTASWLETLFVHELLHYVHLTRPIGFFGSASRVFGPLTNAAGSLFMPGWFVEGVTTWGETALSTGGRGRNPFFEMQHIAPILEDAMYSYDQAGFSSGFAPQGRIYAAGYLMIDYLQEHYGEDAFVELNRTFQRAPFLGMRRAIRRTTGATARGLYEDLQAELEAVYAARRGLPDGTLLTPSGPGDWSLPLPTDRGLVAYGRGFSYVPGLYLLPWDAVLSAADAERPQWRLLAAAALIDQWSFAVDAAGRKALVSVLQPALSGRDEDQSYSDLFVLDLAGHSPPIRLTELQRLYHPALSADGTQMVAVQRAGSYSRLVSVDPDDGELTELYSGGRTTLYTPTFSPDGSLIAVTENQRGRQRVLVLDARSGLRLAVASLESGAADAAEPGGSAALYFPRFARNGRRLELWYGGDRDGSLALYRSRVLETDAGASVAADDPGIDADSGGAVRTDNGAAAAVRQSAVGVRRLQIETPRRVVQDRVAAFAGFPLPDGWYCTDDGRAAVYAAYTADGYALKLADLHAAEALDAPGSHEMPATSKSPETLRAPAAPTTSATRGGLPPDPVVPAVSRPYRDFPRPILWLPQLALKSTDDGTQFDVGALLIAASNLQRHEVALSLLYNPQAEEPSGLVSYSFTPGPTRWNLSAGHDYSPADERQTTTVALGVGRPLLLQTRPDHIRQLNFNSRAEYRRRSSEQWGTDEEMEFSLRLAAARANRGALRDFFGPTGRRLSWVIDVRPDWLDADRSRVGTTGEASLTLQPLRHLTGPPGTLQIVPTAVAATSTVGDALGRLPYLGGGFDDRRTVGSEAQPSDAALGWLGRMTLRMPLGVYDAAWRGLGSTGSGVALYLEQGGAADERSVTPTASSVAGIELTTDLRFNTLPIQFTAGAAVRLPHPDGVSDHAWVAYLRLNV